MSSPRRDSQPDLKLSSGSESSEFDFDKDVSEDDFEVNIEDEEDEVEIIQNWTLSKPVT